MDLDASRKAQLIMFMCKLLRIKEPIFPNGYIAYMVYKGTSGIYMYCSPLKGWKRVG